MNDEFETSLQNKTRDFPYPPTPDISSAAMKRISSKKSRFFSRPVSWSVALIVIFLLGLMLVPPARAAILDFIQIGIVQIFRGVPTPAPFTEEPPVTALPLTATPTSNLPPSLLHVAGETDLITAQGGADFPILLPAYPAQLGLPDKVYVQDMGGAMVMLVWLDRDHPDQAKMSLHEIPSGSWAIQKFAPRVIQETTVNGQNAAWTVGPYFLQLRNGQYVETRLVDGNTLIWADKDITYRLESNLTLEEAIKVAESLQPFATSSPTP